MAVVMARLCQLTLLPNGQLAVLGLSGDVMQESYVIGNLSVEWILTMADGDGHLAVVNVLLQETILWRTKSRVDSMSLAIAPGLIAIESPSTSFCPSIYVPSTSAIPKKLGYMRYNKLPIMMHDTISVTNLVTFRAIKDDCIGGISF